MTYQTLLMEKKEKTWIDCYETSSADLFHKTKEFQAVLKKEESDGNFFFRRPLLSASKTRVPIADPLSGLEKEMIMLGSNSYLGLTYNPRVVKASIKAAKKYGYGTGAVSLFAGTTDLHLKLEELIARYYRAEDAILFPTGYAANIGTISGIVREKDVIINDMFNHASIFDGCFLSKAEMYNYAHRNMYHLEKILKKLSNKQRGMLIITDGVFSMDGDIAPLDKIFELARFYGARVMVDEAHSLGVIGPNGRGTAEYFDLEGKIDITIGTLSKAPGAIGGYAVGSKEMIDYLRYYARPYFFSTSIPAPVIAGLIEVFNILEKDVALRKELWIKINYMIKNLKALGFDIGDTRSAIIPIMIGNESKLKNITKYLHQKGIFMNFVAYPAVAKKRCRLRMSMMAGHSIEDLDYVLRVLADIGRIEKVIV